MSRRRSPVRQALLAAGLALAALGLAATTALADDWGQRAAGRHVYDPAGVLTAAQVTDLEASAAAVDRAGAPTVVYLRRKDADDATTRADARGLMDAWAVESAAGAKYGFVLLFNLRPTDTKHGSAALVAGERHATDGLLPDSRLQEIYDGPMKSHLATGDLAGAVSAALADVADDLARPAPAETPAGAPQPSLSPGGVAASLLGAALLISMIFLGGLALVSGGALRSGLRGGSPDWTRNRPSRYYPGVDPNSDAFIGYTPDADAGSSVPDTSGGGGFTGGDGGASSGSSSGGGSF